MAKNSLKQGKKQQKICNFDSRGRQECSGGSKIFLEKVWKLVEKIPISYIYLGTFGVPQRLIFDYGRPKMAKNSLKQGKKQQKIYNFDPSGRQECSGGSIICLEKVWKLVEKILISYIYLGTFGVSQKPIFDCGRPKMTKNSLKQGKK